jgi:hypothetical protein
MNRRLAFALLAGLAMTALRLAHRVEEAREIAPPIARGVVEAVRDEDLSRTQAGTIYSASQPQQQEAPAEH